MNTSSPKTKRIFFNTTSLTMTKLLGMVVSFISTPIVVHTIGMANFGLWVVLSAITTYFSLIDFGLGSTFITQFSLYLKLKNVKALREVMTFGALFYMFLGALFFPVAQGVSLHIVQWFHVPQKEASIFVFVFWGTYAYLFLSQGLGSFNTLLIASERMVMTSMLWLLNQLLYNAVLISSILLTHSLYSFLIANFSALLINTLITYVLARRMVGEALFCLPWKLRFDNVRGLLSFGGWMQLVNLSSAINMELDQVLMGHFVGSVKTGVYQIGNKLALTSRYLPLNILEALLPSISANENREDTENVRRYYVDGLRFISFSTFFMSGFLYSAIQPIQIAWFGETFHNVNYILLLLLVTYLLNNLTGIGTTILRAIALPRLESYYMLLGATLNIVLTVTLAPHFGLWGILWGTNLGLGFSSLFFIHMFHKKFNLSWWEDFLKAILPILLAMLISAAVNYFAYTYLSVLISPSRWVELIICCFLFALYSALFISLAMLFRFFKMRDVGRLSTIGLFRNLLAKRYFKFMVDRYFT